MSGPLEDGIKRWTAKRNSALVIEIIQGKTTVAEASRSYDLAPSEIENWVDDARQGMENALKSNPLDVRQQYEKQLRDLQEAYGEAMLELRARKKVAGPHGAGGRQLIRTLHEGLLADGDVVPITKLCAWFGVPRRTVYYQAGEVCRQRSIPGSFDADQGADRGRAVFRLSHSRVACWVSTRTRCSASSRSRAGRCASAPSGRVPVIEAMPSVAQAPNERWST